jgi:hypothetical protein
MDRVKIARMVRLALCALACILLSGTKSLSADDGIAYLNTAPGVAYIGSRACSGCHSKIYQDYIRTAMGRSVTPAADFSQLGNLPATASVFNDKLNRHFEVSKRGSDWYQAEYESDPQGREVFRTTHKLEYAVGSGVNGYTFIVRRGSYLFQAPLSYYSRQKAWDLSPGYQFADYGFNRPIAQACIGCHSGRPQPARDREGLFGDPPFRELAIGCENCHGPGGLHAAAPGKSPNRARPDRSIVNPAKLPVHLAEDICMNCHQGSDTRVPQPGKDYFDFRPGTSLRETVAILRVPLKPDDAGASDLLEHHFSMQLSKCYRESGGRLSCLTCHRIHAMPRPSDAAAYYRSICLTCHQEANCNVDKAQRMARANDCVACHMPKRDLQLIAHSALTNHRIIATPDEPLPDAAFEKAGPELPGLIYVNRPPVASSAPLPPIVLLRAYGELMEKDPSYQPRYFRVLDKLSETGGNQGLVQAALGRKILRGDPSANTAAIEHLSRAVELGFRAPMVYQDLAEGLTRAGRPDAATAMLQRGIETDPYTPVLYKSLALAYINLKRYPEAKKIMELYVGLFPEDDLMRGLLLKAR